MDIAFDRSVEEVSYEKRLSGLVPKLRAEDLTSTTADLDLCCRGD